MERSLGRRIWEGSKFPTRGSDNGYELSPRSRPTGLPKKATLLSLDQIGITVRREQLVGGGEEIVFHPWAHVYQLGPLAG